ncbi:hypothetical protein CSC3H3_12445 [Thalassospira marina]|uniref:Uncharacterized protein n=1 Tax=Thalassospira marina TaxID=2048283 RepID=A0ABM6QA76_9PROT|nr:hypothetical protein CSC3H3_12445 [Thalassospira marina]
MPCAAASRTDFRHHKSFFFGGVGAKAETGLKAGFIMAPPFVLSGHEALQLCTAQPAIRRAIGSVSCYKMMIIMNNAVHYGYGIL